MKLAVIGGTGVYDPSWLDNPEELRIATPYGDTLLMRGTLHGHGLPLYFMNRHGAGHKVPPHRVNYRANIWALNSVGVRRIVSTAAVGSMNAAMAPGTMVFCDQFMDFTKSRNATFFDGGDSGVTHTDMTHPYCTDSRQLLMAKARSMRLSAVSEGVYVATEGPRFETPAEIRAYRILGGDLVGMTGVPEVVLARELGLCYSTIGLVTNYAAGISKTNLTHEEVLEVMADNVQHLRQVLEETLPELAKADNCDCQPSD